MSKKLKWIPWLEAYGYKRLATELNVDEKTAYNWLRKKNLPKDWTRMRIVELSGGVLDYNSFYEV